MILLYSTVTKQQGLWDEINVIIWGASTKLVGENTAVQAEVREMIEKGVHVEACLSCSDKFGVTQTLNNLSVETKYMGEPLTRYIKQGENVITL